MGKILSVEDELVMLGAHSYTLFAVASDLAGARS
jgi:hypothetical protein